MHSHLALVPYELIHGNHTRLVANALRVARLLCKKKVQSLIQICMCSLTDD